MAYISFQPSDHFNPKLYTGTGAIQSITGVGFGPDFSWFKSRTSVASHQLIDSVRGNSSSLVASSNAAAIDPTGDGFTSLDADGYTFNAAGGGGNVNANTQDFVGWNWKAGTTSGLSGGTITPSAYSINTTSGFSIIKYTGNNTVGASIPHGLGAIPELILVKKIDGIANWMVYYQNGNAGNTKYLHLNTTVATTSGTQVWSSTTPTSTLFYVGSDANSNGDGEDFIAYCFTPIKGYSCFANWTGAGGTHPFMYCGFEPAFVMSKNMESAKSWLIYDNKRPGYNETNLNLDSDNDAIEASANPCDFTSQGFKVRTTTGELNAAGAPTLFMAFAAKPFVSSNSIPNTAR